MAQAFIFKQPQMTVKNLKTNTEDVVSDEAFAPDGITITIESEAREIERFNGTDKFPSGQVTVSGTVATILEGDDIWKLFDTFKIQGISTKTLANGTIGATVGGGDTCGTADQLELVIEDKCRDEADVQKRIKLTNVQFNSESIELALNNSDGITPEFAIYANADADGVKMLLGYDAPVTP